MNQSEKKTIVTLFVLVWAGWVLFSQTTNPFDIKPGQSKRDTLKTSVKAASATQAPAIQFPPSSSSRDTAKNSPSASQQSTTRSTSVPVNAQNPFELRSPAYKPTSGATKSDLPAPATITTVPSAPLHSDTAGQTPSKDVTSDISKLTTDTAKGPAVLIPPAIDISKKDVESRFQNILSNYIFWVLFLSLVLITFIVNINRSLVPEIFKSLTSDNQFRVIHREFSKGFSSVLYYLLYVVFLAQGALFFYLLQREYVPADRQVSFLWFILALFLIYGMKHTILFVLNLLFPVEKEVSQYSFILMQFNICLGIILFCINWFLAFTPTEMAKIAGILGLVLFVILYFVRQFRGLLVSARILVFSKFHFFLYLCVVDVLPVVIAGKYLLNQSVN